MTQCLQGLSAENFVFGGQLAAFSGPNFPPTDLTRALGSHRQPKRASRGSDSIGHGSQTPPNLPLHRQPTRTQWEPRTTRCLLPIAVLDKADPDGCFASVPVLRKGSSNVSHPPHFGRSPSAWRSHRHPWELSPVRGPATGFHGAVPVNSFSSGVGAQLRSAGENSEVVTTRSDLRPGTRVHGPAQSGYERSQAARPPSQR